MDSQIPQKTSLVQETARVIADRILSGEWRAYLPGERYLSRILEVGRDTVRKALVILVNDGWVSGTDKGRKRRILRTTPIPKKRGRKSLRAFTVGFLSSVSMDKMMPSTLFEIHRVEEALAVRNAILKVVTGSWASKNRPEERLRDLFEREKCSLWILYRTSRETQRWFLKNKIPCLVRGLSHENVKLPQLDIDWQATAQHAAATLWRKGHRHVGIIAPTQPLRGVTAACNGVLGFTGEGWNAHIIPDPLNREGLVQSLNEFRNNHPEVTALITTRPRQTITVTCWAGVNGLVIPGDISLVSLAYEYFLDEFYPAPDYYQVDNEQVARRVVRSVTRLINGQTISQNSEWLLPEYHPGASVRTLEIND